jgi:hypothetical protein
LEIKSCFHRPLVIARALDIGYSERKHRFPKELALKEIWAHQLLCVQLGPLCQSLSRPTRSAPLVLRQLSACVAITSLCPTRCFLLVMPRLSRYAIRKNHPGFFGKLIHLSRPRCTTSLYLRFHFSSLCSILQYSFDFPPAASQCILTTLATRFVVMGLSFENFHSVSILCDKLAFQHVIFKKIFYCAEN